jgi:hypothetical protein
VIPGFEEAREWAGGEIKARYLQLGGAASPLGLPLEDPSPILLDGIGFYRGYRGGRIWAANASLGPLPNPGETPLNEGETRAVVMRRAEVWWVGLECQIRQENDGVDEMYGSIFQVVPATRETAKADFPANDNAWEMGPDGQRILLGDLKLYPLPDHAGPPADVFLTPWLVEHDEGDQSEFRRAFSEEFTTRAQTVLQSSTEGQALEEEFGEYIPVLGEEIAKLIERLFGLGDDPYQAGYLPLPWQALMSEASPRQTLRRSDDPRGFDYTHSVVVEGHDDGVFGKDFGRYAFYFDVRTFTENTILP